MLILDPVPTPQFVRVPVSTRPVEIKIRSLTELQDLAVKTRVIATLREVSDALNKAQVRHAVLGAIAVGVHGWPRATADVDLLLGPEAWTEAPDGSLTANIPMPETVNGVGVDYLHVGIAGDFLIDAFASAHISEGVPIAPVEVVILTKLIRLVTRDHADIVELLKAGLFEPSMVEGYLERHAPMLTPRFRILVEQARKEKLRG